MFLKYVATSQTRLWVSVYPWLFSLGRPNWYDVKGSAYNGELRVKRSPREAHSHQKALVNAQTRALVCGCVTTLEWPSNCRR